MMRSILVTHAEFVDFISDSLQIALISEMFFTEGDL